MHHKPNLIVCFCFRRKKNSIYSRPLRLMNYKSSSSNELLPLWIFFSCFNHVINSDTPPSTSISRTKRIVMFQIAGENWFSRIKAAACLRWKCRKIRNNWLLTGWASTIVGNWWMWTWISSRFGAFVGYYSNLLWSHQLFKIMKLPKCIFIRKLS